MIEIGIREDENADFAVYVKCENPDEAMIISSIIEAGLYEKEVEFEVREVYIRGNEVVISMPNHFVYNYSYLEEEVQPTILGILEAVGFKVE